MSLVKIIKTTIYEYLNGHNILNENYQETDELSNIRTYIYRQFKLDDIVEPATVPLKPNHIRLYHQTSLENFEKIKKRKDRY